MPTGAYKLADATPLGQYALADAKTVATPGTSGGLVTTGIAKAAPLVTRAVEEVATNPNVPKIAAKVGRVVGGIAPVVAGAAKAGPVGAAIGLTASSKGAWAGGKTGWFTGKLAQEVAQPIAHVLTKAAPYVQALTTIGGVQSALDLAQMAEPNRTDIGTLGIGKSQAHDNAHPALINLAVSKVRDAIQSLISHHDMTPEQAAQTLLDSRRGPK